MKNKVEKLNVLILGVFSLLVMASCENNNNQNTETTDATGEIVDETTSDGVEEENAEVSDAFNIADIPVSNADIGDFPFFTFPKGMKSQNRPIERDYDVIYFPIDGVMTPIEGKAFKVNVSLEDRRNDSWSLPFFLKSYDDAILSAGGQKIFDGKITQEEYDRYKGDATYLGENGSIGYTNRNIRVYVIRRADGKNIYIQLTGDTAAGKLNILQEEGFEQTIQKITSDEIIKDLNEKGKSILYINFDVDKSDIKPDGKEVVDQIAEALRQDASLKISIEGHTDNTGDGAHNKKLSNDRANAVMQALTQSGIAQSRLAAKGFGTENPLVANDSEENKAKNRRVELVRM